MERASTPHAALALLAKRGSDAFDLVLSVPFTDPVDAPYAWLDRLKRTAHAPVVICGRCPEVFYADHRRRGYAAFLEEPFDVQNLIDLVAALCPPDTASRTGEGGSCRTYRHGPYRTMAGTGP